MSEVRLIDANALCKLARNNVDGTVDCNDIMRFPTVDAVPVTRCGQCKHGSKCPLGVVQCKMNGYKHRADWFCADGERK